MTKTELIQLRIRCVFCNVLLEGREQFIGHMVAGHDQDPRQTEESWDSVIKYTEACRS